MPEGISALSRTQIGVEALAGSATDVPTTIWRGMATIKDNQRTVFPKEKIGIFGGTTRSYIPETGGEVELSGEATYEQLGYVFNSGIYLVSTPTTDTSSAKIWAWTMQQGSSDTFATTDLGTLVVETGDNIQAEIAHYGYVKDFTLSGKAGEALTLSANVETRAPAIATFTASLSVPTVEDILFSKGSLYIDDTTGTIGTTAISTTLLDMSLKVKTGWTSKKAKDNRLDFSFIKRADDESMLDVTFEHNSIALAEKVAWRAGTERAIRLVFLGSALTTTDNGAAYDTKALQINLYGKWENFGAAGLEEADGNNVYKGTFKILYSSTATAKMNFKIYNELATMP